MITLYIPKVREMCERVRGIEQTADNYENLALTLAASNPEFPDG